MKVWWLSFVNNGQNKGVVIIDRDQANDVEECAKLCWENHCNPGGEVACWELDTAHARPELRIWLQGAARLKLYQASEMPFKCVNMKGEEVN